MNSESTMVNRVMNRERIVKVLNGWVMPPMVIFLLLGAIAVLIYSIVAGANELGHPIWGWFVTSM